MLAQRQLYLSRGVLSAAAILLLLATSGVSAQTTMTPDLTNSTLLAQLNDTLEEPRVLLLHRPCGAEHESYCGNGGKCVYPQDNETPSCICKPQFSGPRCMFVTAFSRCTSGGGEMIGIFTGLSLILVILILITCCVCYKRYFKSAPLKKSAPSETSV